MTHGRNSDFLDRMDNGHVVQVAPHPSVDQLEKYIKQFGVRNKHSAAGKSRQAAWFVSNCATPGRRESYVKELEKLLKVDVYGKCGRFTCSRENQTACLLQLESDYKFCLSFENSICEDYVTEKFFNMMKRKLKIQKRLRPCKRVEVNHGGRCTECIIFLLDGLLSSSHWVT